MLWLSENAIVHLLFNKLISNVGKTRNFFTPYIRISYHYGVTAVQKNEWKEIFMLVKLLFVEEGDDISEKTWENYGTQKIIKIISNLLFLIWMKLRIKLKRQVKLKIKWKMKHPNLKKYFF